MLQELLELAILHRKYEAGPEPIIQLELGDPEIGVGGELVYSLRIHDSAHPDVDSENGDRMAITQYLIETIGGEISQNNLSGNEVVVQLRFDAAPTNND